MKLLVVLILALVMQAAHAQGTNDALKDQLADFFGTEPPLDATTTRSSKILDWQSCQCVPHYLCDGNRYGIDVNNASVTGWGELGIRNGDKDCQESIDICCLVPKDPETTKPTAEPLKGCGYRNTGGLKGIIVYISGAPDREVQYAEFPWVVAVLEKSGAFAGAGVLIHPQVVMTTAHNVFEMNPSYKLRARAGEWDMKKIKKILPCQEQNVQEIYLHKDFENSTLNNDVALLKLAEPFKLAEHINVICLPDRDETFDGADCIANDWGEDVYDLESHNAVILKRADLKIIPHADCNKSLKRTQLGENFELLNSFVCAQGKKKNHCKGDTGAPLTCPIGNDRYKLAGLAGRGIACGQRNVPGVYTNVPMFRQWIEDQMAVWGLDISGSVI